MGYNKIMFLIDTYLDKSKIQGVGVFAKENINYYPHLKTGNFLEIVSHSEFIICRSGYSNIMDLSVLNKRAILVPTPGQTEQEYLAKYHSKKSSINWVKQKELM